MPAFETIIDVVTAAGIAILAVPVLSLNDRKKRHATITDLVAERRRRAPDVVLDEIADTLQQKSETQVNRWRRLDELCLYAGYVLLLGGSIMRVFI